MYDSNEDMAAFRAPLINDRDVSYLGPVFIGEPFSQPALVVYDTGSDWLTVKSCYTEKHCNYKKPKDKKDGNEHHQASIADIEDIQLDPKFLA